MVMPPRARWTPLPPISARRRARTGNWWTLGGRLVPVVAQQRQAMAGATSAGERLARAGMQSATIDVRNLSYHEGRLDLASVERLAGPLRNLDKQMAAAQSTLSSVQSAWLTAPIASRLSSFGARVQKAGHAADLGVQLVGAAPDLLGGDGCDTISWPSCRRPNPGVSTASSAPTVSSPLIKGGSPSCKRVRLVR